LSLYTTYNELLSHLHLYWLMHSAEKGYAWSQEYTEGSLSDEFSQRMKHKLHLILSKMHDNFVVLN
jgi:hypothetical protein